MQAVLAVHSIVRWAVLLFGIWTVLNAITGLTTKRAFSKNDNISNLLFMIFCDIQLLFGVFLLVMGPWLDMFQFGMGEVMKNKVSRFFIIEHGVMMIIAWVLVHVGRVAVKKTAEPRKHKTMLIYFGIALLLILISIPWPFRGELIGRNWFPSI
jgi:hypothetical protein